MNKEPKPLADLLPAPVRDRARVFHGTSGHGWAYACSIGALGPIDEESLVTEASELFDVSPEMLRRPGSVRRAPACLYVADCFAYAARYAGRSGSEAVDMVLQRAARVRYSIGNITGKDWEQRWNQLKPEFESLWSRAHDLTPLVLALDVPFDAIPSYRRFSNPPERWTQEHPPGVFFDINMGVDAPLSLECVVAVLHPEEVAPEDRNYDPNEANILFLMNQLPDGRSDDSVMPNPDHIE